MIRLMKLPLVALLAVAPVVAHAQSQVLIQRHGGGDPQPLGLSAVPAQTGPGLGTAGAGQATADDDGVFCGIHDVFEFWEEDENGDEVPGTHQWACTD